MSGKDHRQALIRTIEHSYLEIFPARGIEDRLELLPAGAYVAITCSSRKGINATLDLAERLTKRRLRLVPHVSARQVIDEAHLTDIVRRLDDLQVDSVFIPGGDVAEPAGKFTSSLQVLKAMAEIDHHIEEVGVAAYPEGHPFLDARTLLKGLRDKQQFATYMVTQMCFDPRAIIRWLADMRACGIHLPAWIGLPGVTERAKLFATALRIGVGESARFVTAHRKLLGHLFRKRSYQPDDLLMELAVYLDDPAYDIPGFHLYSFNQVESTEKWRVEMLARFEA